MHRSMPDPTKGGEASGGSLPDAGRLPRNNHLGIRQKSLLQVMQLMQLMQILPAHAILRPVSYTFTLELWFRTLHSLGFSSKVCYK
jgi:hypothetical protein